MATTTTAEEEKSAFFQLRIDIKGKVLPGSKATAPQHSAAQLIVLALASEGTALTKAEIIRWIMKKFRFYANFTDEAYILSQTSTAYSTGMPPLTKDFDDVLHQCGVPLEYNSLTDRYFVKARAARFFLCKLVGDGGLAFHEDTRSGALEKGSDREATETEGIHRVSAQAPLELRTDGNTTAGLNANSQKFEANPGGMFKSEREPGDSMEMDKDHGDEVSAHDTSGGPRYFDQDNRRYYLDPDGNPYYLDKNGGPYYRDHGLTGRAYYFDVNKVDHWYDAVEQEFEVEVKRE